MENLAEKIMELRREHGAVILAQNGRRPEVQDIARRVYAGIERMLNGLPQHLGRSAIPSGKGKG